MPTDISLTRTVGLLQAGVGDGLHPGAQLYVSVEGSAVADVSVGNATTTRAMTSDTVTVWMSLTKGITAVAVAQVWEKGRIGIDDPVCAHLPEFGVRFNGTPGEEAHQVRNREINSAVYEDLGLA